MTLGQFVRDARQALSAVYADSEAGAMVSLLCERLLGVDRYAHIVKPDSELGSERLTVALSAVERLLASEPIQYILARADFYGRSFKVNQSVLIPRQETELLCRMAIDAGRREMQLSRVRGEQDRVLRVLDLCTGSGCIAWTLAAELPGAQVVAVDISPEALEVARSQDVVKEGNGVKAPVFMQADVLDPDALEKRLEKLSAEPFDIVVSNPPYVLCREKALMNANVLEHEPELALFVPDTDFGLFYRPIAKICKKMLNPGSHGFVEINEAFGEQTAEIFANAGLCEAGVVKDLNGRDRFVKFQKMPDMPVL